MRRRAAVATCTIALTAPLSAELSGPADRKPAPAFAPTDANNSPLPLPTVTGKIGRLTLLIDRRGRVVATHVGVVEKDAFERELRLRLAEKGGHRSQPLQFIR